MKNPSGRRSAKPTPSVSDRFTPTKSGSTKSKSRPGKGLLGIDLTGKILTRQCFFDTFGSMDTFETVKDESAVTVMSLGEVVATYKSRPQKSAAEYSAEIAQIAQYYGAGIVKENCKPDVLMTDGELFRRLWENLSPFTEDAEVVSIETVTAPGCAFGEQP
jgi:hypothetical protein